MADVVKPALIEISAYKSGKIELEIHASIEALLTGINSQYQNTQDSPMAEAYDELRVLPAVELKQKFSEFEPQFLSAIQLNAQNPTNEFPVSLSLGKVDIPEPGYTKVPRISTIWRFFCIFCYHIVSEACPNPADGASSVP